MNDITRQILEQMAAGRIPDDIPDSAEYADTLRRLAHYFAAIQNFTIALSNGDLSQSLQGVTGPVAGGLKSLQSGLRHLTWQTKQIAAGDFSQTVDFMGDFSTAFNTMVADLGEAHGQLQQSNRELSREIEARKLDVKALSDSRQQLMDIIDFLPDATFVLDNDKRVIAWNRAIEEMTGISKAEILGQGDYAHSLPFYGVRRPHLLDLLDIDDKELVAKYSYVVRNGNRLHAEMFTPALYGGKGAWVWGFGAPLYNSKGERIGAIEAVRDITEQKRLEKMLNQQARTDQMTGVNNRAYFLELLGEEIERAGRYGRSLCVMMLDLDHFKSVNDTRGHAAGDEALRTVTRVLRSTGLRQSDFLGRIGGEEFAVALPETNLHDAADAAERVRSQLAATVIGYTSGNFSITVSIGVSEYRDGDSQDTLLQRADQAMYQAKQTGRNRVCLELCP